MINKIMKEKEREIDAELKQLGVKPRIYHFRKDVTPFTSITIAEDRLTWAGVRRELNRALEYSGFQPATHVLEEMRKINVYGTTVCDGRDQFNRWKGRNIAKGRLLKHLKEMKK